ncbi:MAG: FAD-binding oxidoreductase [Solirubrobacterales bacterium]
MAAEIRRGGNRVDTRSLPRPRLDLSLRQTGTTTLAGGDLASPVVISDWGGLRRARVAAPRRPASEDELRAALLTAAESGTGVALRGYGHSAGGQSFGDRAAILDLRGLNRVLELDHAARTVRLQGGASWADVTRVAEPVRLGPTTKQEFETFTIGGSIAANAHGKSIDHGPLVGGVSSLRLMKADGSIVTASRNENAELFAATVGGYGLLGVIVEATLELVEDRPVSNEAPVMRDARELIASYIERVQSGREATPLCYGFLDGACRRGFYVAYVYDDDDRRAPLAQLERHEPPPGLFNAFVRVQRRSALARRAALRLTWAASRRSETTLRSRRLLLWDEPPAGLVGTLLQKFVVPVARFADLVERAGEILRRDRHELPVLTPHFRFVPANGEALLSLSPEDGIALILSHLARPGDRRWVSAFERATGELLEAALELGGRHYLTFDSVACREQLLRGYPGWDSFVALKRRHDPDQVFTSSFYERYEGPRK